MKKIYLGLDINNRDIGYTTVAVTTAELAEQKGMEIVNLQHLYPNTITRDFGTHPFPVIAKRMFEEWVALTTRAQAGLFLMRSPSIGCGAEMTLLKTANKPVVVVAVPQMFFSTSIHALATEVIYWESGGKKEIEEALERLTVLLRKR